MKVISGIRAAGSQVIRIADEFGQEIKFTLRFRPGIAQWFIDVDHQGTEIRGVRITNSANTLWQFAKILNFGLGVIVSDGGDIFLINDFSSGRASLNLLTMDELEQVDDYYVEIRG